MDNLQYDVIIFGAGVAGLWLANVLKRSGYNVIVIEKDKIGSGQTIAAQGMIHGGQKYALAGKVTDHATSAAAMPERWEACLGGWGEIDLTSVKILSDTQVMWPAGSILSEAAVFGAAKLVNAETKKIKPAAYPEPLAQKKKFKGPVYEMPEKVLDVKSLLRALAKNLKGRILKGTPSELLPDGQVAVNGKALQAQLIVFTSGAGNEEALRLLRLKAKLSQRRPLRQVMVRPMPFEIYGHGIVGAYRPRVTITSHPIDYGQYMWYLGANIAEQGATMTDADALEFARKELAEIFPEINWAEKEWATYEIDRAEPFSENDDMPPGPHVQQRGRVLIAWPTKMTFTPALSDQILRWMREKEIKPECKQAPPDFPAAEMASFPWEDAKWRN